MLESLAARHPSRPVVLALSDALQAERGTAAALAALTDYLARHVDLAAWSGCWTCRSAAVPDRGRAGYRGQVVHEVVRSPARAPTRLSVRSLRLLGPRGALAVPELQALGHGPAGAAGAHPRG